MLHRTEINPLRQAARADAQKILGPQTDPGVGRFHADPPALVILAVYVVFPAVNTLYLSFLGAKSENFVGLENYIFALTDPKMLIVLRNNALWLVFVTGLAVGLGLLIAVMADRIGRWEPVAKSVIFLPMAISAVGASVIWKFVYAFQPPGRAQIGLLNAIVVALGGEPQGWLTLRPWNNFFLIIVMVFLPIFAWSLPTA